MRKRNLPKVNAGSPIFTNAQCNRNAAMKCFKAGMSPAQVAAAWPEIWICRDGKIGQRYDYEINDGSGRFETNRRITDESVKEAIAKSTGRITK